MPEKVSFHRGGGSGEPGLARVAGPRLRPFAALILAVIQARSVLDPYIVARLPGKARRKPTYRRVQNFYREVKIDYNAVAVFIVKLLSPVFDDTWTISFDRANWMARRNEVNLLPLSL